MANYLSPFSSRQFIDANGNPYSGALLFTYVAGSSTKVTTYKDEAGSSAHANPIVLNTRGEPADGSAVTYPIWQIGSAAVKFVLAPSTDTDPPGSPIATWDNIDGINDTSTTIDQWITGPTPTYVSATSFTLVGDQTSTFHVGRRIKTTNSGGTIYSTISVSAYGALTTITVVNDSGTLDAGLSAVSYGILSKDNDSIPNHTRAESHSGIEVFSAGIDLTGGQLKFPATQSASADANTLDDYEEGTWTPSIGGTATYNAQVGYYTKVGRLVNFSFAMTINVIGTGSTSLISGLPFVPSANEICVSTWSNAAASYVYLCGAITSGNQYVTLKGITAAAASVGTATAMGSGTNITMAGSFIV